MTVWAWFQQLSLVWNAVTASVSLSHVLFDFADINCPCLCTFCLRRVNEFTIGFTPKNILIQWLTKMIQNLQTKCYTSFLLTSFTWMVSPYFLFQFEDSLNSILTIEKNYITFYFAFFCHVSLCFKTDYHESHGYVVNFTFGLYNWEIKKVDCNTYWRTLLALSVALQVIRLLYRFECEIMTLRWYL